MSRSALALVVATGLLVLPTSSVRAKDELVSMTQGQNLANGEMRLTQAVPTSKARFVSVLAKASAGIMTLACFFVTEPTDTSVVPGVPTVPNLVAFKLRIADTVGVQEDGPGNFIVPATRSPIMGPYLQCSVSCDTGPCTDAAASAYFSTK